MANSSLVVQEVPEPAAARLSRLLLDFAGAVHESRQAAVTRPRDVAGTLTRAAARKAAATSGSLALPPGPLGLLTILPDLLAVWRIQSQLVADIAAAYGKTGQLTQEQMLYCLFRHMASQAVRDLVMRAGERWLIQRATLAVLQSVAQRIGLRLSKKMIGAGLSRWLPLVGAAGVAGYAYYDTRQVAATAIALFEVDADFAQTPGSMDGWGVRRK